MKTTRTLIKVTLIGILGLILLTCQKDDQMMINSDSDSELLSPQFKTGGVTDYLLDLIADIEGMMVDGPLNKGNGKALIRHIENIIRSLGNGNENAASDQLMAFIDQIDDFVDEGKVEPEFGEELVELPIAIIESFDWGCGDPILDLRDGSVYNTVQIGDQCWMAENLAFLPAVFPPAAGDNNNPHFYVYGYDGFDVAEAKATFNYNKYGVLYNWPTAMDACPEGWHLPSDEEWKIMEEFLGMIPDELNWEDWRFSGDVGFKLKSTTGWFNNGNGNNSSGFNALPGGFRSFRGTFGRLNEGARFYTTSSIEENSYYRYLKDVQNGVMRRTRVNSWGSSVRCLKDTE